MDNVDVVNDLFELAMVVQEIYLKKGDFPRLTMSEIHVLEAVSKEQFPTMSNVAGRLNITTGTLTTAVKKIVEKGFLIRERSQSDGRIIFLKLTDKGYLALRSHSKFHQKLGLLYTKRIPKEDREWVFTALYQILGDLEEWRKELENE